MGRIISNGIDYSGLIYTNGCFIDTDNVIANQVQFLNTTSYTATQDCFVQLYLVGANGSDIQIKIDNKIVYEAYYDGVYGDGASLFLKKGQVLSVIDASTQYESYYTVYGIQQGSTPFDRVIANPQGTPTANLYTIQIGETIYQLPSGGGGQNITRVQTFNTLDDLVSTRVTVTQEG